MLPSKVQALLNNKPRLLGVTKDKPQEEKDFRKVKKEPKRQKEGLSLGLEKYFNVSQPRPIQIPVEDNMLRISKLREPLQNPIDPPAVQQKNVYIDEEDILIEDYIDMIPDQREPLHKLVEFTPMTVRQDGEIQQVRCLIEEEKSKKFLIDALAAELKRLDQHSEQLEDFLNQNQQLFDELKGQNNDIEMEVREMVRRTQQEERIRVLESQLKLDDHLRLKIQGRLEEPRLNEELAEMYEDNEKLFAYADKVMAECAQYRDPTPETEHRIQLIGELQETSQSQNQSFSKRKSGLYIDTMRRSSIKSNYNSPMRKRSSMQKVQGPAAPLGQIINPLPMTLSIMVPNSRRDSKDSAKQTRTENTKTQTKSKFQISL